MVARQYLKRVPVVQVFAFGKQLFEQANRSVDRRIRELDMTLASVGESISSIDNSLVRIAKSLETIRFVAEKKVDEQARERGEQ